MGLDMYLTANKYVSGWNSSDDEEKSMYVGILEGLGLDKDICPGSPGMDIDVTVMYWRKANSIHNFFVSECQDGVDECQKSYVPREKLEELVDLCEKEIEFRGTPMAEGTALTPTSGFFFGSTEKDDWFYDNMVDTVTSLRKVLDNPKLNDFTFHYQSSW